MALPLRGALSRAGEGGVRRLPSGGLRRLGPGWEAALTSWLVARVAVGLGFLAAHGAVDALRPGQPPLALDQGLVAWDGAFYRDIATVGYERLPEEALRFFPLFPLLGKLVGAVLPGGATTGLVLVANLSALVAGWLLHRLVLVEGGSEHRATTAVWLVAVLPASSVLVLAYTEALFLALTIGAFLAMRRGRWGVVAALALLAGLCRPSAALLALPILLEALAGLREARWGQRCIRLLAVVAAPLGTALYLVWVGARFGDPLRPLQIQSTGDLRGRWVNPVTRILDAVGDAPSEGFLGEALHVPWIVLFFGLAVVVARRLPASYTAYTVAVLVLAVSAESLGSFERYGLAAFPLAIVAADLLRRPVIERPVLLLSTAALAVFTALTLLMVFVP